jgi:ATP phosphoribosyltransferase regulatory subunit HisZ
MLFAYNEYESSLGSLDTRAGVALGLVAAALLAVLPAASEVRAWTVNVGSVGAIGAVLSLAVGVGMFTGSLLSRVTRAGYSTKELLSVDWKKPRTDFYLQQLSNLEAAIKGRRDLLEKKARLFNSGMVSALVALFLLLVSRAWNLLALGRP